MYPLMFSKRLFKFSVSLFIILLVSAVGFMPAASARLATNDKPDKQSQLAFSDLSACLSRDLGNGKKPGLNVVFLVDESWSIWKSDPNSDRKDILANTAQQIVDLNLSRTGFNVISFSGQDPNIPGIEDAKIRIPWTEVKKNQSTLIPDQIREKAPSWVTGKRDVENSGGNTDWESALRKAQESFTEREMEFPEDCKALIWFTDGGVNVRGNVNATKDSLQRICGRNPLTGFQEVGASSLIDFLRSSQVSIFGVLYTVTARNRPDEASRQSFMRSIVEGTGEVNTRFLGNGGARNYKFYCGQTKPDQPRGVLLVAGDVFRLASEFSSIGPMLKPETPMKLSSEANRFRIGGGISSFDVQIPLCDFSREIGATCRSSGNNWSLLAPDGSVIATQSGVEQSVAEVTSRNIFYASVSVEMKSNWIARSERDTRYFKVIRKAKEPIKVWLYTGLSIRLKPIVFEAGKQAILEGLVTDENALGELPKLDLEKTYDDNPAPKLEIQALTGSSTVTDVELSPDGKFKAFYKVPTNVSRAKLHLAFTAYSLGAGVIAKPLEVLSDIQNPAAYPYVSPNRIVFSPLVGDDGTGTARIVLHPGSTGNEGKICFDRPHVSQDSSEKDRKSLFRFAGLDGPSKSNCFEVGGGEASSIPLNLKVMNPIAAKGTVLGTLRVQTTSSKEKLELSRDIAWTLSTDYATDKNRQYSLLALFLFLGIVIPYILLLSINYLLNRLVVPQSLRAASFPVEIKRNLRISIPTLTGEEFRLLPHSNEKTREFSFKTEGGLTVFAKAKFSLNPFAMPVATIAANEHLIITDRRSSKSNALHADSSPMLTNLWIVAIDSRELSAKSSEESIEGQLLYLANLNPRAMEQSLSRIKSELSGISEVLVRYVEAYKSQLKIVNTPRVVSTREPKIHNREDPPGNFSQRDASSVHPRLTPPPVTQSPNQPSGRIPGPPRLQGVQAKQAGLSTKISIIVQKLFKRK